MPRRPVELLFWVLACVLLVLLIIHLAERV
jgi:hypothetical protein